MLAYGMIRHIKACNGREDVSELALFNQFEFLNGAVISPMIMNTRYRMLGILTDEMNGRHEDLLTDSSIHQRIDLGVLPRCFRNTALRRVRFDD